jgi:hypothetical protein
MNWTLQIPYRSRSDSLTDVVEAARQLPTDEERAVVRASARVGRIAAGSATTAGEVLDRCWLTVPGT